MTATDKQISYLEGLTAKVNAIIKSWPECPISRDNALFYAGVNWRHERSMGMTVTDASIKISAFRSLLRGLNMQRSLLGLPQF